MSSRLKRHAKPAKSGTSKSKRFGILVTPNFAEDQFVEYVMDYPLITKQEADRLVESFNKGDPDCRKFYMAVARFDCGECPRTDGCVNKCMKQKEPNAPK